MDPMTSKDGDGSRIKDAAPVSSYGGLGSPVRFLGEGSHFLVQPVSQRLGGDIEVILRLKPEPELCRGAEEPRQPERGIRRNASLTENDLVYPPRERLCPGQACSGSGPWDRGIPPTEPRRDGRNGVFFS